MIGIIGAMDEEVAKIVEVMEIERQEDKACMSFKAGKLNGKDVVVVRSGIGKVNAAVCTQILVDDFGVDYVINTGIAGSLKAEINIADIVISSDVLHHDMDASGFGYPLGQIPRMDVLSFEADKHLIDVAKEACAKVLPEIQFMIACSSVSTKTSTTVSHHNSRKLLTRQDRKQLNMSVTSTAPEMTRSKNAGQARTVFSE